MLIKKSPKNHRTVQNFDKIELASIDFNPDVGWYQNVHLLLKVLPIMEGYPDNFRVDGYPHPKDDSGNWMTFVMSSIQEAAPWFFAVLADDEVIGACWAHDWEGPQEQRHSVMMGGVSRRGVDPDVTRTWVRMLCGKIFEETGAYIIRAACEESNRASRIAMIRAGFSHQEQRRAWILKDGAEITGIIMSITRSEFEGQ
jgi:RimJ/RimL family protein N-acetyltransferase